MEENTVTNIEVRLKPQRSKMFVVSGYVHIQNKGKSNIFSLSDIVEVNNRFLNKEEKKLIGELKVIFQEKCIVGDPNPLLQRVFQIKEQFKIA